MAAGVAAAAAVVGRPLDALHQPACLSARLNRLNRLLPPHFLLGDPANPTAEVSEWSKRIIKVIKVRRGHGRHAGESRPVAETF